MSVTKTSKPYEETKRAYAPWFCNNHILGGYNIVQGFITSSPLTSCIAATYNHLDMLPFPTKTLIASPCEKKRKLRKQLQSSKQYQRMEHEPANSLWPCNAQSRVQEERPLRAHHYSTSQLALLVFGHFPVRYSKSPATITIET